MPLLNYDAMPCHALPCLYIDTHLFTVSISIFPENEVRQHQHKIHFTSLTHHRHACLDLNHIVQFRLYLMLNLTLRTVGRQKKKEDEG